MAESRPFVLPVSIVGPTDIARLLREMEAVDEFFRQNTIRKPGDQIALPRLSRLMDQLATENQLNLLHETHRSYITDALAVLHKSAPVMHLSFSVDPPGSYVQRIVAWMRKNIHGEVLVTVGLQPNIGAGCIVRTRNQVFDFSLREYFKQSRGFFIEKLHESISDENPVAPVEAAQVPAADVVTTVASQPVAPATAAVAAPQLISDVTAPLNTPQQAVAQPQPVASAPEVSVP